MAPKLRVYQLARELNRDNSEIIRELQHMGVPVTSHSNTVEDRLADQLRSKLGVFGGDAVVAREEPEVEEEHVKAVPVPEARVEVTPAPVIEETKPAEPEKPAAPPVAPPVEHRIEVKPEIKPEPKP